MGAAGGVALLLIRTAAGDMYPPERRARGISYVLFGSVFGAILGPALFSPLFAGKDLELDALTVPWLAGGRLALVALVDRAARPTGPEEDRRGDRRARERAAAAPRRRCARSSAARASSRRCSPPSRPSP